MAIKSRQREAVMDMGIKHEMASERRIAARYLYRTKGTLNQQTAVTLAEKGYGWSDLTAMTGVDEIVARLLVLGTE